MAGLEPSEDTMSVFSNTLKSVYDSTEFSDLTIQVNDVAYHLHKLIVGGHSSVLKGKFFAEDRITLEPIKDLEKKSAYEAMFRFMYGLKYDDGVESNDFAFHFDVFRVAGEYNVLELQKLAAQKVRKIASKDAWDVDEFIKILGKERQYITTENEELWEFLKDTCHDHIAELCNTDSFEDVLSDDPPLATSLILRWGDFATMYRCPKCEKVWPIDRKSLSTPSFCPNCGQHEENYENFAI